MGHFTGPVLESGLNSTRKWYADLPVGYDPDYVRMYDDFVGIAHDQTNDWTVVKDSGASVAIQADTVSGRLLLSSAATTDGDGASIQQNEIWQPASGRDIWFAARVQVSDADDIDFFVGLCENFATNPEACLTASNRIGFQITEGDASLLCITEASDTETSNDSAQDAADATDVDVAFHVIGTNSVEFYVNDVLVQTNTTNIPTALMTPAVMHISGSATGTFTSVVDFVQVVQSR